MAEDRVATESWKDKIYEPKLTESLFDATEILAKISVSPTVENLKIGLAEVMRFYINLITTPFFMKKIKSDKIKDRLEEIEVMLYGNEEDERVVKLRAKYDIDIETDRHKKTVIKNAQNILKELREVIYILKQFASEQGFFITKPSERKYGKVAIEDTFEM